MILTARAPMRVSLVGGGTDFKTYFSRFPGRVLGGAINQYVYVNLKKLPPFHAFKSKIVYSEIECVSDNAHIKHPLVKACLEYTGVSDGLEIFHQSDLPGRSGTGSSSSFSVALLHALNTLQKKYVGQEKLAQDAIDVERNRLGEAGGYQDQYWAAYGGFRVVHFRPEGVDVESIPIDKMHLDRLSAHLLLSFTGVQRSSHEVTKGYESKFDTARMHALTKMVDDAVKAVIKEDYEWLGKIISESWRTKAVLPGVTNERLTGLYNRAMAFGAYGGKIIGAGGGGCLLMVVPMKRKEEIENELSREGCVNIPFQFSRSGSKILYFGEQDV